MDLGNELVPIAIVVSGLAGLVWNHARGVRRGAVGLRGRMAPVEVRLESLRGPVLVSGRGGGANGHYSRLCPQLNHGC